MTKEQKVLFMKIRYLNDKLKEVNADKEKIEKEIAKLSYELFGSIKNDDLEEDKKVIK